MQGDPTTIMLDQIMRVVVMTVMQTSIQALIYGVTAYSTVRLLVRHLEKRGY